jgi:hypothetical protein
MMADTRAKQNLYDVMLEFLSCKGVSTIDRVKLLAHELGKAGLHPSLAMGGEKPHAASDINGLVDQRYREMNPDIYGGQKCSIAFGLLQDWFPNHETHFSFGWMMFKDEHVKMDISGGVWSDRKERRIVHESLAQKTLSLGLMLHPIVQPMLGAIRESNFGGYLWEDSHVRKRKIITLNWVNFFGPEYVAAYGREVLMNTPGYRTEEMPDGGVFYQSRPTFVIQDLIGYRRWKQDIIDPKN